MKISLLIRALTTAFEPTGRSVHKVTRINAREFASGGQKILMDAKKVSWLLPAYAAVKRPTAVR
jgi:hypothetical protein